MCCGRNVARSDSCLGLSFVSLLCMLGVSRSLRFSQFQSAYVCFCHSSLACLSHVLFPSVWPEILVVSLSSLLSSPRDSVAASGASVLLLFF